MNQRIQTLALKCGAWHQVYGNRNFMLDEHFEIEKFAELIVKEMCDVFDKRAEPGTGFYEPHKPAELIREHFGVEE